MATGTYSAIVVTIVIFCHILNTVANYDVLQLSEITDGKTPSGPYRKNIFAEIAPPNIKAIISSLSSSEGDSAKSQESIQKLANAVLQMSTALEQFESKVDHLSAKLDASLFKQNDVAQKQTQIATKVNTIQKSVDDHKFDFVDMHSKISDKINRLEAAIETQRNVQPALKTESSSVNAAENPFVENHKIKEHISVYSKINGALLSHAEISAIKEYTSLNVPENTKGVAVSRHDADQSYAQHIGECGGIIVAGKGKVYFVGDEETGSNLRCVWTIRANRKSDVHIKLLEDDLGSNYITVSDYTDTYWNNNATKHSIKKKTAKILSGDRATYVLDGPVVFVTLFYTRPARFSEKLPPSFKLYFEGVGNDVGDEWKFTHYHFTEDEGAVKYPTELASVYKSNEVVTFAVNPRYYPIYVNLTYVDLEVDRDCFPDSLSFLALYNTSTPFYEPLGRAEDKYSYCGKHSVNTRIGKPNYIDTLIAIFKSDGGDEHAGFRFVWSASDNLSPFHILQRWKH